MLPSQYQKIKKFSTTYPKKRENMVYLDQKRRQFYYY